MVYMYELNMKYMIAWWLWLWLKSGSKKGMNMIKKTKIIDEILPTDKF